MRNKPERVSRECFPARSLLVDSELAPRFEREVFQSPLVRGLKNDAWSHVVLLSLFPACGAETPAVSGVEGVEGGDTVLTMSVTIYHRLQAVASGEKISRKEEGYAFAIALRLAGVGLWIATFGYLLLPAAFQWAAFPLPLWARWSGVVSGMLCSLLMYWTLSSLGKNLTDTVVTRQDATLVTHGPYRWVRHPFYVTPGGVGRPALGELANRFDQLDRLRAPCRANAERRANVDRTVRAAVP